MPLVCIDCRYIGPRPSGIGKVIQGLVDFAPQAAPDLDFLLLKRPDAPEVMNPAENVREVVVSAAANSPATMWWLPRLIDLSRVNLFHATFNILPHGLKMPSITTVHDVMWLTNPELCNPRFWAFAERRFYQHGISRALRQSAAIATVSEASGRAIAEHLPATKNRIRVTRPGVSPEYRPVEVTPQHLAQLGLDPARRFVLVVGQNAPYKNHAGAIRTFAEVSNEFPDVDLVLVQRLSHHSGPLPELIRTLGVTSRVHFLPRVELSDLILLFSAAQALLHPSFCEGFGLPLAEAMACGCPIVTSNRSAMAEVVGDTGLLADPDNPVAMAAALRLTLLPGEQGKRARREGPLRAAGMNWHTFAEENIAIYREVLCGSI